MMVGLYYVIQEMDIFPRSVANNFCVMPLPKYLDSKTVLIYRPHPVGVPGVCLGLFPGVAHVVKEKFAKSLLGYPRVPFGPGSIPGNKNVWNTFSKGLQHPTTSAYPRYPTG
jgi:hypothetical protein